MQRSAFCIFILYLFLSHSERSCAQDSLKASGFHFRDSSSFRTSSSEEKYFTEENRTIYNPLYIFPNTAKGNGVRLKYNSSDFLNFIDRVKDFEGFRKYHSKKTKYGNLKFSAYALSAGLESRVKEYKSLMFQSGFNVSMSKSNKIYRGVQTLPTSILYLKIYPKLLNR